MRRVLSVLLTLTMVVGFVTPRIQALPDIPSPAPSAEIVSASDVEGRGWATILGCIGCLGAGMYILSSGATAILTAASAQGSALAVGTCAGLCRDAIS